MTADDFTREGLEYLNAIYGNACRKLRRIVAKMELRQMPQNDPLHLQARQTLQMLAMACAETHRRLNTIRKGDRLPFKAPCKPPTGSQRGAIERYEREIARRERYELGFEPDWWKRLK